jgi:DNA-binding CsgD family transcriptional regulator
MTEKINDAKVSFYEREASMLTVREYEKLLDLLTQIRVYDDDIRPRILQNMDELYHGYSMAFFLTDENEQFINPVSLNIHPETMDTYKKYYYKTDIFHTTNIEKNLLTKSIVHITDIMSTNAFEHTEFYSDHLRKMGVYDEIGLPLFYQNRLLGVIGIMKPQCRGRFTETELECAEIIRKNVMPCLKEFLDRLEIRRENSLILNCTKDAPVGIAILDGKFNAIHYNQAAVQFLNEIRGSDDDYHFGEDLMKMLSDKLYQLNFGSGASLQTTVQNYSFRLAPFAAPDYMHGFNTYHTVYIVKNGGSHAIDCSMLKTVYNLSGRECEIVSMLCQGYSNKRIADELYVSPHTIKTHMQNIFRKMGSGSRTEVLHKAMPPG